MKNEIYDNMLSAYGATTEQERRNAIFEVNQQVILAGALQCRRFSSSRQFDFTKYFPAIVDAFTMVGREVENKEKRTRGISERSNRHFLRIIPMCMM